MMCSLDVIGHLENFWSNFDLKKKVGKGGLKFKVAFALHTLKWGRVARFVLELLSQTDRINIFSRPNLR